MKSFNVTLNVFSNFREVFNGLTLEDNLESIKAAIAALEEFSVLSSRLGNYINLTLTANTTDETANKYRTLFGNAYAALNSAYTKVYKFIGSVETDITADEKSKKTTNSTLQKQNNNTNIYYPMN